MAEGVQDTEVRYTHGGDVYFVMPGGTRKVFAYYHWLRQKPVRMLIMNGNVPTRGAMATRILRGVNMAHT